MRISDWSSDVCSSDLAFERRPGDDHLDDLRLRFADHEDTAARDGAHEALELEDGQGFADRCAADAEVFRELALVETDLAHLVVDVHFGDRLLDGVVGQVAQALAGCAAARAIPQLAYRNSSAYCHDRLCSRQGMSERSIPVQTNGSSLPAGSLAGCFFERLLKVFLILQKPDPAFRNTPRGVLCQPPRPLYHRCKAACRSAWLG